MDILSKDALYARAQLEKGAEGTPHYQACVGYKTPKRLATMIKRFPGCHVEITKNAFKAWTYCGKADTRIEGPVEHGIPPAALNIKGDKAERNKLLIEKGAEQAVKDGDIDIKDYGRVKANIDLFKNCTSEHISLEKLDNYWIYGPPGIGKTSKVIKMTEDQYYDKDKSKYWNGYTGQNDVLIDDVEKDEKFMLGHLKKWCQHKCFQAEDKFGQMRPIRPKRMFVTSNFHFKDIWETDVDREALARRFTVIHMT